MRIALGLLGALAISFDLFAASGRNAPNPEAVAEVLAGTRSTANAAWWGFDAEDATEALQRAIDSGAEKVVVPDMGSDWNVRPIRLAGDQELVLQRGVVIAAKRGEYRGRGDTVFTARDVSNLTIRGRGATVRDAVIRDSIIGNNATVESCLLDRSIIGDGAHVTGDYRSLNIADDSHVRSLHA